MVVRSLAQGLFIVWLGEGHSNSLVLQQQQVPGDSPSNRMSFKSLHQADLCVCNCE